MGQILGTVSILMIYLDIFLKSFFSIFMCVWYACSVCVCVCLNVYSHMCVGVQRHMCTFMCVLHACRGLRLITGIIFHCSSILFFEVGPVSQIQSSLAWPLSLASLLWVSFVTLPRLQLQAGHCDHLAFFCGFWGSNSIPHICGGKHLNHRPISPTLEIFLKQT